MKIISQAKKSKKNWKKIKKSLSLCFQWHVYFLLPVLRFTSTGHGFLPLRFKAPFDCFNEGERPREGCTTFLL